MPTDAAHGDGTASSAISLLGRAAAGCLAFALIYAVALAATAPAGLALRLAGAPPALRAQGTIWRGAVALDGGFTARWTVAPRASARLASLVADVALDGPGAVGAARVVVGPGRAAVEGLGGRIGPTLAFAPACAIEARAQALAIAWRPDAMRTAGEIAVARLDCAGVSAPPFVVTLAADGAAAGATARDGQGRPLGSARLDAGLDLAVTLTPEGAALVPGAPAGGVEITLPLRQALGHLRPPPAR